jgi:hypothetical protein
MQWSRSAVSAGLPMSFFDNPEVRKTVLMTKLIDEKNMGKMREMVRDLTGTVFSDGWTVVNHHPIVNIIMGVISCRLYEI